MALFDLHNPWVFTTGILGNIISICVYFAPLPTFIRIYKRKSTLEFQCLPYLVALFSAMLWMYYALIKKNVILLISVNSVGIVVETIYVTIFLWYASKDTRKQTLRILVGLNAILFSVIYVGTSLLFKGHYRIQVVGWICVTFSISVFAAPLSIVFHVVRTRSVEFMPLTLSFFLTLSAVVWFAYGLLQADLCVALPNVFGFILGLLQMLLYGIYKNIKGKQQTEAVVDEVTTEKKLQLAKTMPKPDAATADHIIIDMVKIGGGGVGSDSQSTTSTNDNSSSSSSDDDDDSDESNPPTRTSNTILHYSQHHQNNINDHCNEEKEEKKIWTATSTSIQVCA